MTIMLQRNSEQAPPPLYGFGPELDGSDEGGVLPWIRGWPVDGCVSSRQGGGVLAWIRGERGPAPGRPGPGLADGQICDFGTEIDRFYKVFLQKKSWRAPRARTFILVMVYGHFLSHRSPY